MCVWGPPPEVRGTLARVSALVFCVGLLVASPSCTQQPKYFALGQPIPIDSYTLTVSSLEMSYSGSQRELVVFLRWTGVRALSKSDRAHFVAICSSRRFTLLDSKGNKYDDSEPMLEEKYRATEIADRIAEAGRHGINPSPSEYDSLRRWAEAAQRKLADGEPDNWAVVFRISPESESFTLLISRSSSPFGAPFGDQPAAVSLGR